MSNFGSKAANRLFDGRLAYKYPPFRKVINGMIDNNQTVFTVRDILQKGALIQYVVHDDDGDWQFFPGYEVPPNDMMIVTLVNIVEYDNSIVGILNLEKGSQAYRRNTEDEWLISKL